MFNSLISRASSRVSNVITQHVRFNQTKAGHSNSKHPFMEFFTNSRSNRTGRSWSVQELRTKSFEDLHKLWFVILKERNALATYQNYCRASRKVMHNRDRIQKCRKSHAAIKFVLNERRIEWKKLTHNHRFLDEQAKKQERRRLERKVERFAKRANTTPNQIRNINPQDKTWRRKTAGQSYLAKLRPRIVKESKEVPPSASV